MKRGMGIAAFFHGSGFTGSGERYLNSLAGVDVTSDGQVRVLVSSTEFGQGTNTILTQIAAEAMGLDLSDVRMAPADTQIVPNSGPTVASRTAMVVGKLIERAGKQLISMLREHAGLKKVLRATNSLRPASVIAMRMAKSSPFAATNHRRISSGMIRNTEAKPIRPSHGRSRSRRLRSIRLLTLRRLKSFGRCRRLVAC